MMRIITGRARGTHLLTLEGETTRPTTERAKEAVFSSLGTAVTGTRVLDLFAGSGQLALEAVSRGAASAVLVDAVKEAAEIAQKNVVKTHFESECRVICRDYAEYLNTTAEVFDLVFLDPPYRLGFVTPALRLLDNKHRLAPGAIVIAETAEETDVFGGDTELAGKFTVTRRARYGKACVLFLRYGEVDP